MIYEIYGKDDGFLGQAVLDVPLNTGDSIDRQYTPGEIRTYRVKRVHHFPGEYKRAPRAIVKRESSLLKKLSRLF